GTLSGNPLAMTAGIVTLRELQKPGVWDGLERRAAALTEGIGQAAREAGIPIQQTRVGTMFATFFTETPIRDWTTVKTCDTDRFGKFFTVMLENGVYLAPSQFEAGFISTAHGEAEIARTIEAAHKAFAAC
ncbi:MAG TPA: aminotransferase class III-fold pyridoxal phosphate-dependent enzyme, partial [Devosia sp.]|nr:aminotransferase class III-fold pyridoxal phosphate-dependent enzyme [Devosia sp.]